MTVHANEQQIAWAKLGYELVPKIRQLTALYAVVRCVSLLCDFMTVNLQILCFQRQVLLKMARLRR